MKNLIDNALLDFEKLIEKKELKELSYEEICSLIEVFSNCDELEKSQKLIDYFNNKISWKNNLILEGKNKDETIFETLILNSITNYFSKNQNLKTIKKNIKLIEILIKEIEDKFCEEYLLIKNKKENFFAKENFLFLNFCDELSDILNEFEFTRLADKLFLIKGKLELGVQRYFIQKNEIISFFNPETKTFKIADKHEKIILSHLFNYDNDELKNIIKIAIKEFEKNQNIEQKLEILLFLKDFKDEFEKLDFKYLKKILKEYPRYVVNEKDFNIDIEKSLFPQVEVKFLEFKKEKIITYNLNNFKTKILICLVFGQKNEN